MKTFTKRTYRHWTDKELDDLRKGKIPAKRTYGQCYLKAKQLGIEPPDPPTGRKKWSKKELDDLRKGKLPEGRSFSACQNRGYRIGIRLERETSGKVKCIPLEQYTFRHDQAMARAAILSQMHDEGLTYDEIAARVGVTKQCVYALVRKYRVEMNRHKQIDEKKVGMLMKAYNKLATKRQ
jgi:hypothetical protein